MRILVDVDGVLTDCQGPLLKIANDESGQDFKLENLDRWNLFEAMGLDSATKKRCYDRMGAPGWCSALRPFPDAQESIKRIREFAIVHFVTSPVHTSKTWVHERTMWLCDHFGASFDDVTHTSAKHHVAGDVLIDDKVKTLLRWLKSHPDGIPIKFLAPGNKSDEEIANEAANWAEAEIILREIRGVSDQLRRRWVP